MAAAASRVPNIDGSHHRADRPLRGQAPQLAQRCGGASRRLDLVHRSARSASPAITRASAPTPELPSNVYRLDPAHRRDHRRRRATSTGPTGSPSRRTSARCTWSNRARTPRRIRALLDAAEARVLDIAASLIDAGPGTPDGFRVDVDGNLWCGWGMGSAGTGRRAGVLAARRSRSAVSRCPSAAPTLCFGGAQSQPPVHGVPAHSIYSLYVNTQGAPGGLAGATAPDPKPAEPAPPLFRLRRPLLYARYLLPALCLTFSALAPAAPITRLVVAFPAGGPASSLARVISRQLGPNSSRPWSSTTAPGANGAIARQPEWPSRRRTAPSCS